jgi:hypothetical protein
VTEASEDQQETEGEVMPSEHGEEAGSTHATSDAHGDDNLFGAALLALKQNVSHLPRHARQDQSLCPATS